ncbi:ABC transporter substrate-binding protein [Pseudooceanicola sp. CBS1P-1]|uniref:Transporter substrate-binding domain-containing protein n=1 Tax=Pseudooceanicola albus TaxID=2692189 RepID=A0A6L7G684_9RHOB|nr:MULTISPECIES: ABC transporter substrate-binding protein [Pseudooceanicola]MBT9386144.1 ABC transporter substrate-binding protein [Pseudooceanicola endophyticus]MXN19439.1 transporter substrate-binding domain-containing protein [Pseudooceanicola albus]
MKHVSRRIALTLCAAFGLAGAVQAAECTSPIAAKDLVEKGKLTMAVSPTLPPMAYADSTGKLMGLRIDLGDEIARRLCLEPSFVSTEYATMVPGLKARRWDLIDAGLFVTPERLKILYMIPYESLAISASTRPDDSSITKIEDLSGKTISTEVSGYDAAKMRELNEEFKAKGLKPMTIQLFDNYATVFQALRAGQVDAAVSIDPVAKQYQDQGDFRQALSGMYATPGSLTFDNADFAATVEKVMEEMQADGWLPALMEKYGVKPAAGGLKLDGPGL